MSTSTQTHNYVGIHSHSILTHTYVHIHSGIPTHRQKYICTCTETAEISSLSLTSILCTQPGVHILSKWHHKLHLLSILASLPLLHLESHFYYLQNVPKRQSPPPIYTQLFYSKRENIQARVLPPSTSGYGLLLPDSKTVIGTKHKEETVRKLCLGPKTSEDASFFPRGQFRDFQQTPPSPAQRALPRRG